MLKFLDNSNLTRDVESWDKKILVTGVNSPICIDEFNPGKVEGGSRHIVVKCKIYVLDF